MKEHAANALVERGWVPDSILRAGIRKRLVRKLEELKARPSGPLEEEHRLVERLRRGPIAVDTQAANEQHYELPPEFFVHVLGPNLKYSCGLWEADVQTLEQAEERMLERYLERAGVSDGMRILDLGCGWGSLSLFLASRFPNAQVTGLCNSENQARFIQERAARANLTNLRIKVCDINDLPADRSLDGSFDRILSIEMFEHVRNHGALFDTLAPLLRPDGQLFVHVFCHRQYTYLFDAARPGEWLARYFFQGGIMPSEDYLTRFHGPFRLLEQWQIDGRHYQRTANAWLENMDRHRDQIEPILDSVYGRPARRRWWMRWRLFFLACAELWGYEQGREWYVAHYLFEQRRSPKS